MIDLIHWLGYSSFVIEGSPLIYINPWRVAKPSQPADIILISDHQFNHCSAADIAKVRGAHTRIIASEMAAREIEGAEVLRPWQSLKIGDRTSVKAVPAYPSSDTRFPMVESGLGFVISLPYYDVYYAGNSQPIPEMASIHPDLAILPIDGRGTMNVNEAAQVARQMRPKTVWPCNWGVGGTTRIEALMFAEQVGSDVEVILTPPDHTQ